MIFIGQFLYLTGCWSAPRAGVWACHRIGTRGLSTAGLLALISYSGISSPPTLAHSHLGLARTRSVRCRERPRHRPSQGSQLSAHFHQHPTKSLPLRYFYLRGRTRKRAPAPRFGAPLLGSHPRRKTMRRLSSLAASERISQETIVLVSAACPPPGSDPRVSRGPSSTLRRATAAVRLIRWSCAIPGHAAPARPRAARRSG